MKKIYLAIPYSRHEEVSFKLSNEIAAELIKKGHIVFAPISMSHPIAVYGNLKGDWETWKKIDFEFINWCDEVIVINFDNDAVENSTGVQEEIKYANILGKKVKYFYENNNR
jgi:nucleoside 2-deoxyribosyltransferase